MVKYFVVNMSHIMMPFARWMNVVSHVSLAEWKWAMVSYGEMSYGEICLSELCDKRVPGKWMLWVLECNWSEWR